MGSDKGDPALAGADGAYAPQPGHEAARVDAWLDAPRGGNDLGRSAVRRIHRPRTGTCSGWPSRCWRGPRAGEVPHDLPVTAPPDTCPSGPAETSPAHLAHAASVGTRHLGGVTKEVLIDNPRALVIHHDAATRQVEFNDRFQAFAAYWGFRPRACAPYRARTKGKDERGVGYVKRNAIAGHRFESWAGLQAHLAWWQREIADRRRHGTTGEVPLVRFAREAECLRPCADRPPFGQLRDLIRTVHADCAVVVDTNAYSVPWRLIGERVRVVVSGGRVRIDHGPDVVAEHIEHTGRHTRITERAHLVGINRGPRPASAETVRPKPELLRPLDAYAAVAGGSF